MLAASIQSAVDRTQQLITAYIVALNNATLPMCAMLRTKIQRPDGTPIPCGLISPHPIVQQQPEGEKSRCQLAPIAHLEAYKLYLVSMEQMLDSNTLRTLSRLSKSTYAQDRTLSTVQTSGRKAHQASSSTARPDLRNVGTWYRYAIDALVLPFGITKVLYLDYDTRIVRSPSPLFEVADESPVGSPQTAIVVAARGKHNAWYLQEFKSTNLTLTGRVWGFNSSRRQSFNNGVLLIRTKQWCEIDALGKMMHVADHHAVVQPLWDVDTDQAVCVIALAKYAHFVDARFNSRLCWSKKRRTKELESAIICHGWAPLLHEPEVRRMISTRGGRKRHS